MNIEKERVVFEKTYGSLINDFTYINDDFYIYGKYQSNVSTRQGDYRSDMITQSWNTWVERAKLAHQETQALQEELIKTNAEKLHAQMVADAAIEELNALKARLKDGVIVPRIPTDEILEALGSNVANMGGACWLESDDAHKAMIEAAEKEND